MVTSVNPLRQRRRLFWLGIGALLLWVGTDLYVPRRNSLRQFDPVSVARLETAMWRSYYDKRPVLLFWQLAGGLREQFHAPFWRSFGLAFQATKAAFTFKQGGFSRINQEKALPDLMDYYASVQELSTEPFDVSTVARLELEWWIVHRQRDHYSYADLAQVLAEASAALYRQPVAPFLPYGRLRAEAMRQCDTVLRQPGGPTDADWQRINQTLVQAWGTLHRLVNRPR